MKKIDITLYSFIFFGSILIYLATNSADSPEELIKVRYRDLSSEPPKNEPNNQKAQVATANKETPQKSSFDGWAENLFVPSLDPTRFQSIVDYLNQHQTHPQLEMNSNPYTGEIQMISLKSPLPDTLFFKSQFIKEKETGNPQLQTLSIFVSPQKITWKDLAQKIQQKFPQASLEPSEEAQFKMWNLSNGYVLWIYTLSAEDVNESPSLLAQNIPEGAIQIAMEMKMHDH